MIDVFVFIKMINFCMIEEIIVKVKRYVIGQKIFLVYILVKVKDLEYMKIFKNQ